MQQYKIENFKKIFDNIMPCSLWLLKHKGSSGFYDLALNLKQIE